MTREQIRERLAEVRAMIDAIDETAFGDLGKLFDKMATIIDKLDRELMPYD